MENQQKSTKSTLTTEQFEVIAAVVSGATVTAATKAAGVDRSTFYLWRRDAHFVAELNRAQKERDSAVCAQLHSLTDAALDALREMLESDTPPAVRLKAALEVLVRSGAQA